MTATFDQILLALLEDMIGFKINPSNVFWTPIHAFNKCHIKMESVYTVQPYNFVKKQVEYHLKHHNTHKSIIITNTAKVAKQTKESLDTWLNCKNKIKGDSVIVIGDQETELKNAFTNQKYNTHQK